MALAAEIPHFPDHEPEAQKTPLPELTDASGGFPVSSGQSQMGESWIGESQIHLAQPQPSKLSDRPRRKRSRTDLLLNSFYDGVDNAYQACAPIFRNTSGMVRQLRRRVETTKDARPLQFLAVLAGSAFAAGVAIRLWRTRS